MLEIRNIESYRMQKIAIGHEKFEVITIEGDLYDEGQSKSIAKISYIDLFHVFRYLDIDDDLFEEIQNIIEDYEFLKRNTLFSKLVLNNYYSSDEIAHNFHKEYMFRRNMIYYRSDILPTLFRADAVNETQMAKLNSLIQLLDL